MTEPDNALVEAVARALCQADLESLNITVLPGVADRRWIGWIDLAKPAIAAVREWESKK